MQRIRRVVLIAFLAFGLIHFVVGPKLSYEGGASKVRAEPSVTDVSSPIYGPVIFSPERAHLWNRIYKTLFTRHSSDGTEFGINASDILLWNETYSLLRSPHYDDAVKLLDEFISSNGGKLVDDPRKKAVFQHDLWAVFDWLSQGDSDPVRRRELQKRLALVIRSVSLTREQILNLPDNYDVVVKSGVLARADESSDTRELLNAFDAANGWISIGNSSGVMTALSHTENYSGRSSFRIYLRTAGGVAGSDKFLRQLREIQEPWITRRSGSAPISLNPQTPRPPDGMDIALVRRMLLIDTRGEIVPSRLTEAVQIISYGSSPSKSAGTGKGVTKLYLNRTGLFSDLTRSLRPIRDGEKEFVTFLSNGIDPFETARSPVELDRLRASSPDSCAQCHFRENHYPLLAYARTGFTGEYATPPNLARTDPQNVDYSTIQWKRKQYSWGLLQGLLTNTQRKQSKPNNKRGVRR